eukprot:CAMPEP_0194030230 /NCGR_PEP_ID=MMETSP0009_2-20130614/3786_1 /TAXON_ID=210454 /ORGANISM="Grammatophora oceanica, Strain CCMP 410" /LENGTH=241 /DNA_ID=CAMNT_0038670137 /DNA_START=87 /DNA_END=812 /DNA_ORIENTATION=+
MTAGGDSDAPNLTELPSEERLVSGDAPYHFTDEDLPPLRMHATRVPERLSSSTSSLQVNVGGGGSVSLRRKDRKGQRTRSRSPSLNSKEPVSLGDSSVSSLEDLDSDILTDRMGLEGVDMEKQRSSSEIMHVSVSSLPPVNERLSDETLEDVHAFSDVSKGTVSRGTSIATGGDVGSLAVLDEIDEEGEEGDVEEDVAIHISNMENLTIQEEPPQDVDVDEDENSDGALADAEDNGTVPTA